MGKKAKSRRHEIKMKERRKEKAAKQALYSAQGAANRDKQSVGQLQKKLGDHPRGPCGNHACTRSECHAVMSRRWEEKKARRTLNPQP